MYEYGARVLRVVDADTLHLDVDLGCDVSLAMTVRLAGVDAPERNTLAGRTAAAHVARWLDEHAPVDDTGAHRVRVRTVKDRREKFGRYLAHVLDDAGDSLAAHLVATGHAVPYSGGRRA